MSHLGQRLSALIDGELGDFERDRVLTHLVGCDACRAEAVAFRALKRRMHALGETSADTALTGRLMAVGAPDEQDPWGSPGTGRAGHRYPPARYLAAGVFVFVMAGLGSTAFVVGGDQQPPGPKITPAVDVYMLQQSIVTGGLPVTPAATAVPTPASAVPQGRELANVLP